MAKHCGVRTTKTRCNPLCIWCVRGAWKIILYWGEQATAAKSNEITAIPQLLKKLELAGAIITIDARGCQKDIAQQIVDGEGHYILMAKDNQPKLSAAIEQEFLLGYESDFADLQARQMTTVDQGHGRRERRSYTVMPLPE